MLQNVVLGNREGSTIEGENKLLCCSAHVLLRGVICGILENSRVTQSLSKKIFFSENLNYFRQNSSFLRIDQLRRIASFAVR